MFQRRIRQFAVAGIGALMLMLTIGGSAAVGAAAPQNVFVANGCPVGNYACLGYGGPRYYVGGPTYVYGRATTYYPNVVNAVSYFDPRYCGDGRVSIVPDKDGNLINVCTTTGVRIFPVYGGYPYGYQYYR